MTKTISWFMLFVLLNSLINIPFRIQSQLTSGPSSQVETLPEGETWVLELPLPTLEALTVNGLPLDPMAYFEFANASVQKALQVLQTEGKVSQIMPDPVNFAFRVMLSTKGSANDLRTVPGGGALYPANAAESCSVHASNAILDLLNAARSAKSPAGSFSQNLELLVLAGPTIHVYMSSYLDYGTRFSNLSGETNPGATVQIRVENSVGQALIDTSVTAGDDGNYVLYPDWKDCEGYGWSLSPGQMVIVTVNGQTSRFQIPVVSAIVNPSADSISGTTVPNRTVKTLYHLSSIGCNSVEIVKQVTSGADGKFLVNYNDKGDLDHSGWGNLFVYDSGKNYVQVNLQTPYISIWWEGSTIYGRVSQPGAPVAMKLQRGSTVYQNEDGVANENGYYQFWPNSNHLQAGDMVSVTSGGYTMEMKVPKFENVSLNPTSGIITGRTDPGLRIEASQDWQRTENCGEQLCRSAAANVSGDFSIPLDAQSTKRWGASVYTYTVNGNYWVGTVNPTHISYYLGYASYGEYSYFSGQGFTPNTNYTITIYLDGSPVNTLSGTTYSDGSFNYYFYEHLGINHSVSVTDGTHTRTLSIFGLNTRLDSGNDRVDGQIAALDVTLPSLSLDVTAELVNRGSWTMSTNDTRFCNVGFGADGSYSLDIHALGNSTAEDHLSAYLYEPDGDYVETIGNDLWMNVTTYLDDNELPINGHRADPTQTVTLQIIPANGEATITLTDSNINDKYYSFVTAFTPMEGDRFTATNGAYTAEFVWPRLTLLQSRQENRLYGESPAGQIVYPYLYLNGTDQAWYTSTRADVEGNYSSSFDDVYPDRTYSNGCDLTTVGGCRQAYLRYYTPLGHSMNLRGPYPESVDADRYDLPDNDDNNAARASVYLDIQHHTFSSGWDNDWIAINVPLANVGRLYSFQALNMGETVSLNLQLFDSDKTTQLAYEWDGKVAVVRYAPTHAGWHYIRVTSDYLGGYCGNTYDFKVQTEAQWTALLYFSGDTNLSVDLAKARSRLEAVAGSLRNVNVLVLSDGTDPNNGDTWRYLVQPAGKYQDGINRWYLEELNLGNGAQLSDFIRWGMDHYPASHYYVSIADHGVAHQGTSWDFTTYLGDNNGGKAKSFDTADRIEPMELREALRISTNSGARKIDILQLDSCLMGLWEQAYHMKDYVKYLIFSQNEGWGVFAYEKYVLALQGNDLPGIASAIAAQYKLVVAKENLPYTISVIDLQKMEALRGAMNDLSTRLLANMAAFKVPIQKSRDAAQKFDSSSDMQISLNDSYLDLYDFTRFLKTNISTSSIQQAANSVQSTASQAVVREYHGSGYALNTSRQRVYVNLDNSHGLSFYFPSSSGRFFNIYAGNSMFQTTQVMNWDETVSSYFGAMGLPPTLTDPDDTSPFDLLNQHSVITTYLPHISR